MGTCPDCDFDGTNGSTNENNQFPQGYASESRLVTKQIVREGQKVQVMERNANGSPKWGTRMRCPLCGCIKASSKPKPKKGVED